RHPRAADRLRGGDRGRGTGPGVVERDRGHGGTDRARRTRPGVEPWREEARRGRPSERSFLRNRTPLRPTGERRARVEASCDTWAGVAPRGPRPPVCVSGYRRAGSPWHFLYFLPEP